MVDRPSTDWCCTCYFYIVINPTSHYIVENTLLSIGTSNTKIILLPNTDGEGDDLTTRH